MLLKELVDVSAAMRATRSRIAKKKALVRVLSAVEPGEAAVAASYLSGALRQRRTGLGWRSLGTPPPAADVATLTLTEVDEAFAAMAALFGPGSQGRRSVVLDALMRRATADEQPYLGGLVTGELRQGALDAMVVDALADAVGAPVETVRRAVMLAGSTAMVAEVMVGEGPAALARFTLTVGTPVRPMLASSAASVTEALASLGGEVVLDGIRVQIHKRDRDVHVFTRTLEDITHRVPDLVGAVEALPADTIILDGEALLLGPDARPRPFQESSSRIASGTDTAVLSVLVFDLLHLDGEDLIDRPAQDRFDLLEQHVPDHMRVGRIRTDDAAVAEDFFLRVLEQGHEGVVVKSPTASYEAGRRGASWVKVKPVHTLDLVVLAVEWGSGRRAGKLSNIHLGAGDGNGGFVMLGKTFKGMTDAMLTWQTTRFLAIQTGREAHVVHVRPEQVVEIAFDGLQRSTRYPGGVALRFARVVRYRDDKDASDANTIDEVLAFAPQG